MSTSSLVKIQTYTCCATLKASDFNNNNIISFTAHSPTRCWTVCVHADGIDNNSRGFVAVRFLFIKSIKAFDYVITIRNTNFKREESTEISRGAFNIPKLISHDDVKQSGALKDGEFFIKFVMTIKRSDLTTIELPQAPCLATYFDTGTHNVKDVSIITKNDVLSVSKHVLCLVSPVFNAMFAHNSTKEAVTKTVIITDFESKTTLNAINYLHGFKLNLTIEELIGVAKFADKYAIDSIVKSIDFWLEHNIDNDSICEIAPYAYLHSKEALKLKCAEHFAEFCESLVFHPKFVILPPNLISELMQAAVDFQPLTIDEDHDRISLDSHDTMKLFYR